MSRDGDQANTPVSASVLSMSLLSLGLYGMALGEALQLLLWFWPGALQNDAFFAPLFLALGFVFLGGLLLLASLISLKVHWLLIIGVFLLALLAPFVQGKLFPTDPSYWARNWFLTYGGVVVLLSFILLSRVKGIWSILWKRLLVTSAGVVITVTFIVLRGPNDWISFPNGLDEIPLSLGVGVLILIVGSRFATKRISSLL